MTNLGHFKAYARNRSMPLLLQAAVHASADLKTTSVLCDNIQDQVALLDAPSET